MLNSGLFLSLLCILPFTAQARVEEAAVDINKRITQFVGEDLAALPITTLQLTLGQKGKTKDQPWSGSYWALYNGSVAWPYTIRGTDRNRFRSNYETFSDRLPAIRDAALRGTLTPDVILSLSATEKYDLYVGDTDFTLTRSVWKAIEEHAKIKKIEEWEGICHGWSPASAFVKRPKHQIEVPSLNKKWMIPFYPDDLKALVTLLWANSLIQDYTQAEGLRCTTNSPEIDEGNGKVIDTRCKGVNPAVWHLSVLGLVGKQKKSFIINKNNDKEIWNQPVSHYEIRYFNPSKGRHTTFEDAIIPFRRNRDDFSDTRAKQIAYLVGVEMTLFYISETDPEHHATDSPAQDLIEKMVVRYDLELDEAKRIVGGEWLSSDRGGYDREDGENVKLPPFPGFIWRFKSDNPIAMSVADATVPVAGFHTLAEATRLDLVKKAANFRYLHYQLDRDGKSVVSRQELRPQPMGSVIYPLIEWAHQ